MKCNFEILLGKDHLTDLCTDGRTV